jgi:predicted dehydrogenase
MLKGAIIGFGKIAQNSHIPAFQKVELDGKAQIIAAVEPDERNRSISSRNFKEINFYSSLPDMLKKEKIDFIDITSPPLFHSEIIEEAVKHNINIICEKPFTFNLAQAHKVSDLLKKSGVVFMPCHQYKYSPLWIKFKEFAGRSAPDSKLIFQAGVFRTEADYGLPVFNNPWRTDKNISGGGILADTGIHYLYLTGWLIGKPEKITAKTFNLKHNYTVEDSASILLESPNGIAEIILTWAASVRANTARLNSGCGNIIYEGKQQLKINLRGEENIIAIPDISNKETYNFLYISLFNEFIENVICKRGSAESINEAFDSIYLLEMCYKSAAEERTILLNE